MSQCGVGETWHSLVTGQDDGNFTIDNIGAQGYFTGTHGGVPIDGQCRGGRIWYHRRNLYYEGTYSGEHELSGTRRRLPLFEEEGGRISDEEEWVGTHVTLAESDERTKANYPNR